MGSYIPSTTAERAKMLSQIGVSSISELYSDVPEELRLKAPLNIPKGMGEQQVLKTMRGMASKNKVFSTVLRGAGAYKHYIPSIVKYITAKEEFVTAYTPYQAEISQGVLQSIFEYQSMICSLTGMDVSNASVYDGACAAAEAVAMCTDSKRKTAVVSGAVHPDVLETIKTYCYGTGTKLLVVPVKDGVTVMGALKEMLDSTVCCVYMQQPNFYGLLEDAVGIGEAAHGAGAKFIMGCNPISLAVLKSPAECGADIAVGEGQPLGMPLSFGGPYLGFMAAKSAMMRKLPGRIVGQTTDVDGKRAFVLTLQAREQHIRREKASSNICSNQALCALTASVYMAAMGPMGLTEAAKQCVSKSHYFAKKLCEIPGVSLANGGEFFHEFVTALPVPVEDVLASLEIEGILGGLPVEGGVLWCVTEAVSKEELDTAADIIKNVCGKGDK